MGYRIEKDFFGEKEIPDDVYYGVQTLRGRENFHITGMPMAKEPCFVQALGYVKKAAALANRDLGVLDRQDRRPPSSPPATGSSPARCVTSS